MTLRICGHVITSTYKIEDAFVDDFATFINNNDSLDIWMHLFKKVIMLAFWIKTSFKLLKVQLSRICLTLRLN